MATRFVANIYLLGELGETFINLLWGIHINVYKSLMHYLLLFKSWLIL